MQPRPELRASERLVQRPAQELADHDRARLPPLVRAWLLLPQGLEPLALPVRALQPHVDVGQRAEAPRRRPLLEPAELRAQELPELLHAPRHRLPEELAHHLDEPAARLPLRGVLRRPEPQPHSPRQRDLHEQLLLG